MINIISMKGSCLCCGIPLDRATRYVAIADVVIGVSTFIFLFIHVKRVYEEGDGDFCNKMNYIYPRRYEYKNNSCSVPSWLPLVFLVCTGIQFVMGFVLYAAAATKSRKMCRVWLVITGATCLFTGFLLRVYQMLVVSEFSHELEAEQRQEMLSNSCRRAVANHAIVPQPLHIQIPMDHDNNNVSRITSANLNLIGMRPQGNSNNGYIIDSSECQHSRPPSGPAPSYSSSLYLPPTPPSYIPDDEELPPPPYHIAVGCPPAKNY